VLTHTPRQPRLQVKTTLYGRETRVEQALLILDLDETLIWASEEEPSDGCDFRVPPYFVKKRPHLEEFLGRTRKWYQLAVWTSSTEAYARQIVEHAIGDSLGLSFIWTRSQCTAKIDEETHEPYFAKNLKKVKRKGFSLERVLIMDDSPEKVRRSFGNHLPILRYEGQPDDRELLDVLPFLDWLKDQDNFRRIEKRAWRKVV
jgi:Dullard-like phosphatase family protein